MDTEMNLEPRLETREHGTSDFLRIVVAIALLALVTWVSG
jgi:hypothetical protein